jgi:hypothetical protein
MPTPRSDLFHGVFKWHALADGPARLTRQPSAPASIPDPDGRPRRISTIQANTRAICPACATVADGGYVSFEDDLRIAYACPQCCQLVWIRGA